MHWTEDGRIQITRNFALGAAAVIIGLALVLMLLIGMLIAGDGNGEPEAEIDPTPSVLASEQTPERPTEVAEATDQQEETETPVRPQTGTKTPVRPQTGTKTEYSACLFRTHRSMLLDLRECQIHAVARL